MAQMITLEQNRLSLSGEWVLAHLTDIKAQIAALNLSSQTIEQLIVDGRQLQSIDTSGCQQICIIFDALGLEDATIEYQNFAPKHLDLLKYIKARTDDAGIQKKAPKNEHGLIHTIGVKSHAAIEEMRLFIQFIGEVTAVMFGKLLTPWTIRWKPFWANIQTAGVLALPIIGLLNFLVGMVIAYQAGSLLRMFGANIFIVDFTAVAVLRVLGPLLTAIIIAGRTGSAYAAQIGTMVVNEEVDALETIGIHPYDQLVVPKMLALVVALPFLTLFADAMAIFGGMVLSHFYLDITFAEFIDTVPKSVTWRSLMVSIVQAPVFAIIITLVGCHQGFQVAGGADSVGKQTTKAVVQSIFLVIIFVAIFSVMMRKVGL